jgi:hypothetical protein
VDIVQRINVQNSSLLEMAVNELTKLDDVPYEENLINLWIILLSNVTQPRRGT